MIYLIICFAVACVCNSAAIIIHLVSHCRGNRRGKGFHPSFDDLRRADALQKWLEFCRTVGVNVSRCFGVKDN